MIAQLDCTQLDCTQLHLTPPYLSEEGRSSMVSDACAPNRFVNPGALNPGTLNPGTKPSSRPLILPQEVRPEIEGLVQVVTAKQRSFFTQVLAQALRSAGQGTSVLVVQFLKGGIHQGPTHPVHLSQRLDWYRCNLESCIDPYRPETLTPRAVTGIKELWLHTRRLVLANTYELVILDELSLALKLNLIQESDVITLLNDRPTRVELILTGPEMPQPLLSLADQVTELRRSPRV